ncbi:MAG: glycoprotein [Saccharopolyspora sp.]|uniref:DUF6049 family protein n=1 Tax=Saccharopolyspora TaxID=1835 RepID=UPI00190E5C7E|nr:MULTISPECIES: DUF6049 family protein [unclassified Saccharopolyspora]MBK0865292.1 glycoprotein [Saccharopolyspora sp. HNM0986]MBQ6642108.1 glycoprotein [Saccharopolyspora sp.]
MRCLVAVVVAVLLIGGIPITSAGTANAQDSSLAQLEVTKVTPSVVSGPGEVTISGRLTNTSGRTLHDIEARVQRGAPTSTVPATQDAVRGNASTVTGPEFQPQVGSLAPGQQAPFELRIPINGGPQSLQIDQPGTFPLLVNVNGKPDDGGRARVGEASFLLPVLNTPGAPPAKPPQPTPMTMLVPIVDYPRMQREGTQGQRPVLADDSLASSLTPGGRLYDLVQSVVENAGPGSPLGNGLCFAVDPDLLATVNAMQGGYQVRQPDGGLIEGTGAASAQLWMNKLRQATEGRCVISLPYADSDVVALGRAGLPDLIQGALDGALVVRQTLRQEPQRNVLWPIEGALDEPAASELSRFGIDTMLMEPSSLSTPDGSLEPVRLRAKGSPTAVPVDPLLSEALDPLHGTPQESTALSPPDSGALSAQNALGAMAFRATGGYQDGATSVLAPPRRWNLSGSDLRSLLQGMEQLTGAGYVRPTGLPQDGGQAQQAATPPPEARLAYPPEHAGEEIPQPVLDQLARQNYKVGDLFRSSSRDPAANLEPAALTNPLRNGLLRGASSAWRGDPDTARHWVRVASDTLGGVLSRVRLDEFSGKITLTASNAPIPMTVTNDLPVTVSVVLRIPDTAGIKTKDLGVIRVPAQGRRHFRLETEVHRAGQFTVDVDVTTESGTELGPAKRLQLQSYAYDPFTVGFTAIASALLVVLSARRILRRLRARRGRQGEQPHSDSESTAPNPVVRDDPAAETMPGVTGPPPAGPGNTTESDRDRG